MPLITLSQASLAFGDVALLDRVDFTLDQGERIALVGRNGEGKSSLLRILAGLQLPDEGHVVRQAGVDVASVVQEPEFGDARTAFDAVAGGLGGIASDLIAYHDAAHRAAAGEAAAIEDMARWHARLDQQQGWHLNQRVEQALSSVGIDPEANPADLSGGMKKRVALARALASQAPVLLLDEPTNHLDIAGIEWLEGAIGNWPGAVVVVSHDRRFLEAVATRIVELERGMLANFPGTFAAYQRRKADMLHAEAVQVARFDKLLKEEEAWIRKGVEARRTRNEGRVRRLEQLRRDRAARRERVGQVRLSLDAGAKSGQRVAELDAVTHAFGAAPLVRGFSAVIQRGDHVGLVGPNGAGKTTLLKLILGELTPESGRVVRGTQLEVAYFDQLRAALDDEAMLADVISPGSDFVDVGGGKKHIVSYLGDFLFPPQRARAKVKSLSGGERNRLLLARLFARPANLLVLDEPTNDLDIETLELLEALLQVYDGTLLIVSHDRAFLNNVVTQIYAFEGDGLVREYAGGYDDYLAQRPVAAAPAPAPADLVAKPDRTRERKPRLGFNEVRELEALPGRIEAMEAELAAVQARLGDPALYTTAPQDVRSLAARQDELARDIEGAMERWEALESRKAESG
ncbi:MAG: ATP-binding cassette domain-containing protein [Betaproteobacteria bacterium]|nr:ATP-binding cassette domain-containing protein [Betaproteobacteria bacterium]